MIYILLLKIIGMLLYFLYSLYSLYGIAYAASIYAFVYLIRISIYGVTRDQKYCRNFDLLRHFLPLADSLNITSCPRPYAISGVYINIDGSNRHHAQRLSEYVGKRPWQ